MSEQGGDTVSASQAQVRRVLALKRAFQRELKAKPTLLQRTLMDRAAVLTSRAEAAALDPGTSENDVVRLDGAAARARAAMFAALPRREPKKETPEEFVIRMRAERAAQGVPTLGQLLAAQGKQR